MKFQFSPAVKRKAKKAVKKAAKNHQQPAKKCLVAKKAAKNHPKKVAKKHPKNLPKKAKNKINQECVIIYNFIFCKLLIIPVIIL